MFKRKVDYKRKVDEWLKNPAGFLIAALLVVYAVFFVAIVSSLSAKADSLVVTGFAWHASNHNKGPKDSNYNEVNPGLGYEYDIDSDTVIAVGYYKNSIYKHSDYLLLGYQPLHYYTDNYGNIKFGLSAGVVSGYHASGVDPLVVPVLTYMYGDFGFNLAILPVPPISQRGIAAIQFKWRFKQ